MRMNKFRTLLEDAMGEDGDVSVEALKKRYAIQMTAEMMPEMDAGIEEEKEHDNLYSFLVDYLETKEVEMPLSENEFFEWIAAAHLSEDTRYYTKLKEALAKDAPKQRKGEKDA